MTSEQAQELNAARTTLLALGRSYMSGGEEWSRGGIYEALLGAEKAVANALVKVAEYDNDEEARAAYQAFSYEVPA